MTIATSDGRDVSLARGDLMLMRLDLAYPTNTHAGQGTTSDREVVAADSCEGRLIMTSLLRVLTTRVREGVTLVVDARARLEQQAGKQSGEKAAASEVAREATSIDSSNVKEALPERKLELTMEGGGRSRGIEFGL